MAEAGGSAFLDTSVIVRYLTDDPPAMAARAAEIIETDDERVVSELVLVESAYVLTSVYEVPRDDAVAALQSLLLRSNLRLLELSKPMALEALDLCKGSARHSFVDALSWALASEAGPARIYSFDGRFPTRDIEVLG